jgi:hypothetical protein
MCLKERDGISAHFFVRFLSLFGIFRASFSAIQFVAAFVEMMDPDAWIHLPSDDRIQSTPVDQKLVCPGAN